MKFLFTTHPGYGHLLPMAPVAAALTKAGHEVLFACSRSFSPKIEALGFRAVPAGLDWLESQAQAAFPQLAEVSLERDPAWFLKEIFTATAADRMIPDVRAIVQEWRPDALVRNDYEFAAAVVAETTGLPLATIGIELYLPARWWKMYTRKPLAALRSRWGLAPEIPDDFFHRDLYLSLAPSRLQFPEYELPPSFHSLRPANFDRVADEALPAWIEALPQRPTIYATLGTVFNHRADVFRSIIDGLGAEPVNVVITVGADGDPARFGPLPDNIHIEKYLPQSLLLPRCDAAIVHGGYGTTLSALMHGLPILTVPVSGTDYFRAIRCRDLKVGKALKPAGDFYGVWLDFPELTAETVRDSIREMLGDPAYRHNARDLQASATSLPGLSRAVALLEDLAAGRTAPARHQEEERTACVVDFATPTASIRHSRFAR